MAVFFCNLLYMKYYLSEKKKIVIFQTIFKEVFCVLTLCNYTRVNNTFFVCGFLLFLDYYLPRALTWFSSARQAVVISF